MFVCAEVEHARASMSDATIAKVFVFIIFFTDRNS